MIQIGSVDANAGSTESFLFIKPGRAVQDLGSWFYFCLCDWLFLSKNYRNLAIMWSVVHLKAHQEDLGHLDQSPSFYRWRNPGLRCVGWGWCPGLSTPCPVLFLLSYWRTWISNIQKKTYKWQKHMKSLYWMQIKTRRYRFSLNKLAEIQVYNKDFGLFWFFVLFWFRLIFFFF